MSYDEDDDLAAYLSRLRETLIDVYASIIHGITNHESKTMFVQYCPTIFKFLQEVVSKPYNPTKVKNYTNLFFINIILFVANNK